MKKMKKKLINVMLVLLLPTYSIAQQKTTKIVTDTIFSEGKKSDRNVMLNASDANKPREIQIGLPSEDVSVYENGLPTVYSSVLQAVSTHWRSDGSLTKVDLLNPSETAITTGNIAYAVSSFSNIGTEDFQGKINYNANHFGLQRFDANVSGKIANGWLASASIYQNFDPGSFKIRFTDFQDRTQIYKAAITRKFGNKGHISLQYKYSNSRRLELVSIFSPFIYQGDGSVKEYNGFKLGTNRYTPDDGMQEMMDIRTGKKRMINTNDGSLNQANEVMLNSNYTFDNGLQWKFNAKFMRSHNDYVAEGAPVINQAAESDGYYYADSGDKYSGTLQQKINYLHFGYTRNFLATSELLKQFGNHKTRLGLNQWYYNITYWSNTVRYDQTAEKNPVYLSHMENGKMRKYYALNWGGSEFYEGYENKTALYLTDDWQVADKLHLYLGARGEYFKYKGENAPYDRFDNFYIGATNPTTGEVTKKEKFDGSYFNYAFTGIGTYKLTGKLGLTADYTYTTRRPRIEDYATTSNPNDAQIKIQLGRAGIFFNNDWLSLTSMISYIRKDNNFKILNVSNPNNSDEIKASQFNYNIETLGWTTDMVANPFKNFNLHFLFTWQKPTYKEFETRVNFSDGTQSTVNATGMKVMEIPQMLIEIDPSYTIANKLTVWTSFRYFSKTYANLMNALYFEGRWETFGGLKYKLNDQIDLGATVINFLNQTGASGTIAGSELISKEDVEKNPQKYTNVLMAGRYIRPFTVEFSASIKF